MYAQTTTHQSLLARLSAGAGDASWREFSDRYEQLIRGFARRRGLSETDIDDVVQDVMLSLSKAMPGFEYDPLRGKFRSYLKTVVVRAISSRFGQKPHAVALEVGTAAGGPELADPSEAHWESEWRQYHLRRAMSAVKQQFSSSDVSAFEAYALRGQDPGEVARALGMSVDRVYQAKSRMLRRLGELIAQQVEEEG